MLSASPVRAMDASTSPSRWGRTSLRASCITLALARPASTVPPPEGWTPSDCPCAPVPVCPLGTDAAAGASSPVRLAEDCLAYFALFCRTRSNHSGPPDPGWALCVPCALGFMFLSARTRGHRGHSIACKVGLHAVAACDPCLAFSGRAGSGPCLTATVCL